MAPLLVTYSWIYWICWGLVHKNNAVYPDLWCSTSVSFGWVSRICKWSIALMMIFHTVMTRYVGSNVRDIR